MQAVANHYNTSMEYIVSRHSCQKGDKETRKPYEDTIHYKYTKLKKALNLIKEESN
jgi:protoheme ferro-lyase